MWARHCCQVQTSSEVNDISVISNVFLRAMSWILIFLCLFKINFKLFDTFVASEHQKFVIYKIFFLQFFFICLISSRAKHSRIYTLKSRNLFEILKKPQKCVLRISKKIKTKISLKKIFVNHEFLMVPMPRMYQLLNWIRQKSRCRRNWKLDHER